MAQDSITLTVFLKHDQSKNLAIIQEHLASMEWWDRFPPAGVEILSWNVVMGIGQIVTLRMPPELLAKVNVELERSAWRVFSTEFYPTYDFMPVRARLRREWHERSGRGVPEAAPIITSAPVHAVNPAGMPAPPPGLFSHGVVANGFVHVSGMHAAGPEGITGGSDAGAQTQEVFRRIALVLREAGSALDRVVKLTVYAASMADREAIGTVRRAIFATAKLPPAATFIEVSGFVDQRIKVEIDAIAVV